MKIILKSSGPKPMPDHMIQDHARKCARMGIPETSNPFAANDPMHQKWHSFYQEEMQKVGHSFG